MKELSKLQLCVYNVGGLMMLCGAVLPLFSEKIVYAAYIYTIGVILFAVMQYLQKYQGSDIVIRRLRRQQLLGASILLIAGLLMFASVYFTPSPVCGGWQMFLAIGAILELYTSFRIPNELNKGK